MARLHKSSTFRLAMMHLGLFIASVGLILWVAYRSTAGFMEEEVAETIATDVAGLKEHYRLNGIAGLIDVIQTRASVPHTKALYLLATPTRMAVAGNLVGLPSENPAEDGLVYFRVSEYGAANGTAVTAQAALFTLPGDFVLLVGRDTSDIDRLRVHMAASLGWILAITTALGLIGSAFISRSAVRRVDAINRTTRRIIAGDLSGRVTPTGSGDEIDQLAANLNLMLDTIERLMASARQVTDAIAHDLRTPLTRLRSRLELALLRENDDAEVYRAAMQETLAEADRLLATFKALLSIAEAESGARRQDFKPVDLAAMAHLVADLYEPLAEETGHVFQATVHGYPLVLGNDQLLSQAVANLLDNAIKYTPAGGAITLTVEGRSAGHAARITVADTGPGIPAGDREKVLERFVRLDGARATPGNGLGLSLVQAVARLHDAELVIADNEPKGLRVSLLLPTRAAVSRLEASTPQPPQPSRAQ